MSHYLPQYDSTPEEERVSLSRPRRNAIDISALNHSIRNVSSRFSRRNAVDYTSSLVKSDWWHAKEQHAYVPRNCRVGSGPCVPFVPFERKQAGVAMTELESRQDLAYPSELVTSYLPKSWAPKQPFVQLIINVSSFPL